MKWFISALIFIATIIAPESTHAALEFDTSYTSSYVVLDDGNTLVTHDISIKNNLANIYTTNYTLSIGSRSLEDVSASDDTGTISFETSETDNSTVIDLVITDPAIGKDKVKKITISYMNRDIALKNGRIWEINVPRLSNANEISSYIRTIEVPSSFQSPSISIPSPNSTEVTGSSIIYTFSGNKNSSITLFFGDSQYYKLELMYHITNPSLKTADTEIALPPDTEYQRVILDNINPPPKNIRVDDDYNWLAIYSLEPGATLDIKATLYLNVTATPSRTIPYTFDTDVLTQENTYWETTANTIKDLTTHLNTPKEIYDYVVDNYVYSYERVYDNPVRLGAAKAIANPSIAICTEFTDTFIALARASGIPAREVNGYAYTNNPALRPLSLEKDILHAWPEYFDKEQGRWIQVDPTWANTTGGVDYFSKLDFNHITFVRHGVESTYPYPAGAYKRDSSKQIDVSFSESMPEEMIDVSSTIRSSSSNPLKTEKIITVTNSGNSSLIDYLYTNQEGETVKIDYLPPLASQDFTIDSDFHINLRAIPWHLVLIAIVPTIAIPLLVRLYKRR